MKNLIIIAIAVMTFIIGCNVETNSTLKEPNYSTTFILMPFLAMAIYKVTHLKELQK